MIVRHGFAPGVLLVRGRGGNGLFERAARPSGTMLPSNASERKGAYPIPVNFAEFLTLGNHRAFRIVAQLAASKTRGDPMRALTKALILAVSLAVCGAALGACNTTEGFGKDVKETGKDIENKAKENK
jgi:predicted small secreted protein